MSSNRHRAREFGIAIGVFPTGRFNAITDVGSVMVGHSTIIRGHGTLNVGIGPIDRSIAGHGSGDYFISFSTSHRRMESREALGDVLKMALKSESFLDPLFLATAEATEEAILNSLFKAETMMGRDGHVLDGLPIQKTLQVLKRYGHI